MSVFPGNHELKGMGERREGTTMEKIKSLDLQPGGALPKHTAPRFSMHWTQHNEGSTSSYCAERK